MIWQVPRMWEEADVWIIGGGPSVPKQFGIPEKVVKNVIEGSSPPSVYSSYMSFLHDKHVIGINVAYMLGEWIDLVFFGDSSFFEKHMQALAKFPGLKASCHPIVEKYPWVKFLPRNTKHPLGISSNPNCVSWNHNSGSAAISIAANSGAKRIFLLGFDMTLSTTARQHWHDVYKRGVINTEKSRKSVAGSFSRHLHGFPQMAIDAKKLGIEIINVCPESTITQFKKVSLKDLA